MLTSLLELVLWPARLCIAGGDGGGKVKESEYDKRLAQIGKRQWEDFKTTYRPLEREFKERVMDMGRKPEIDRLAGDAAQSVHQAIGDERPAGKPGTGGFLMNLRNREIGRASGVGGAVSASQVQSRARYQAGLENIIAMGRGIENTGIDGLTMQAGIDSSRQYGDAVADSIRDQGVWDAVGTGVGYAGYGYANREAGGAGSPPQLSGRAAAEPGTLHMGLR